MITGLIVSTVCIIVLFLMGYFALVVGPKELAKLNNMNNDYKFLNFNKVLCLSPHPDDVEYSMLGTILKYNGTKFYYCN